MSIFVTKIDDCTEAKFKNFIKTNGANGKNNIVLIKAENVKTNSDLQDKILLDTADSVRKGNHATKGNYLKIGIRDTIFIYLYNRFYDEATFHIGDFIALTNAPVCVAPGDESGKIKYEIICDKNNEITNLTVWIMNKLTPENVPKSGPKHTIYKLLKDFNSGQRGSVFAVVIDKFPIKPTKGSHNLCRLILADEGTDTSDESNDFVLNIFLHRADDLPHFTWGDIIRCHDVRFSMSNNRMVGTIHHWHRPFFWSCHPGGTLEPRTKSKTVTITEDDITKLKNLREWVCANHVEFLFSKSGDAMRPKPFAWNCLNSVDEGCWFDINCQVVEVFPVIPLILRIWDKSEPSQKFVKFVPKPDHSYSDLHDKVHHLTADVWVFGEHCNLARSLKSGDDIILCNLHCRALQDKKSLKLEFHEGNHYRRRIIKCSTQQVEVLISTSQSKVFQPALNPSKNDCQLNNDVEAQTQQIYGVTADNIREAMSFPINSQLNQQMSQQCIGGKSGEKSNENTNKNGQICEGLTVADDGNLLNSDRSETSPCKRLTSEKYFGNYTDMNSETTVTKINGDDQGCSNKIPFMSPISTSDRIRVLGSPVRIEKQRKGKWFMVLLKTEDERVVEIDSKEGEERRGKGVDMVEEMDTSQNDVIIEKKNERIIETITISDDDDDD